ncbi:DUF4393 domain-containing protein [Acinetobacter baumannii]
MDIKDLTGLGAYSPIFLELYKDMAQPAARNVGLALGAITSIGLFLHLLTSWGTERINLRLKDNLEKYADRLKDLPDEEIVQVPPEVAMPIIEKLSYVTNEELRELYIELLAKASTKDLNGNAHPSFVNIINNLSPDEAKFIEYLNHKQSLPIVDITLSDSNYFKYYIEKLVCFTPNLNLDFPQNLKAYLSNLEASGLIQIHIGQWINEDQEYQVYLDYLDKNITRFNSEYSYIDRDPNPKNAYDLERGSITITDLGTMFFRAVL